MLLAACPDEPVPSDTTPGDTEQTTTTTTTAATSSTTLEPSESSSSSESSDGGTTPTTTSESSSSSDGLDSTGPIPGVCGNNIIEEGETCDLAQVSGETCESLGYEGGQLGCLLTCDGYNLLGCFICGNDIIDLAEDCEGEVPDEVDCESLGFEDGFVSCGSDCLYDVSECSICGDGIASGYEQCDGIDFNGQTCASVGFAGGTLGCNLMDCSYVYAGCMGGTYLQDFEPSLAIPAEFEMDNPPWTVDDTMPINGARSARSANMPGGGTSDLVLQVSYPAAGTISFYHRESVAAGWDHLRFYRNGVLQQSWTGINAEAQHMEAVPAGEHTFTWRFVRAGFMDGGSNAVWVDDIELSGGVPL